MLDNNTKVIQGIRTEDGQETLINSKYWEGFNVDDLKTIGGKSILKESITDDGNIEIHTNSIIDITYSELKTLRDNSELMTGTQYRIIDYVTTSTQENTMSAGHPFDIIVEALSNNTLSESVSVEPNNTIIFEEYQNNSVLFSDDDIDNWENVSEISNIPQEISNLSQEFISKQQFTRSVNAGDVVRVSIVGYADASDSSENEDVRGLGASLHKLNEELVSIDYGYDKDVYYLYVPESHVGDEKLIIRFYIDNRFDEANGGICGAMAHKGRMVKKDEYFDSYKLNSWEVKYCLDNDTNRFALADSENGKGVIYYMKDEFGNECSYDFKNIMFKRDSEWMKKHKSNFSSLGSFGEVETWFYTFSRINGTTITDDSLNKGIDDGYYACRYNIILPYIKRNTTNGGLKYYLNNNIFIGNGAEYNHFGENSSNNTFIGIYNNYFDLGCKNNIVYETFMENHIGINFINNTITNTFKNNNINNECDSNTFGYFCYCNVKNNFKYNELNHFDSCDIGNDFHGNKLNSFESCIIGDGFLSNNSIKADQIKYCDFGNYIQWCSDLPSMTNVVFDNEVVKNSVEGEGLKDITLSNGENVLTAIEKLSSNTSKVLFTKRDNVYYLIDIAQNVEEFDGKLECIYELGSFSTNGRGENAAFNIDIIRHPDPTPKSAILASLLHIISIAFSTKISLSGLGDNTSEFTLNSYL